MKKYKYTWVNEDYYSYEFEANNEEEAYEKMENFDYNKVKEPSGYGFEDLGIEEVNNKQKSFDK